MSRPTIGHLDPEFIRMMDEVKSMLQYAFQTENKLTMPVSAPGSAGMETCFVNLVEPGDKVIICRNGVFGSRMMENVIRSGGTAIMVDDDWGKAIDPQKLEDALKAHADAKIVAFVHAETSSGVMINKPLRTVGIPKGCLVAMLARKGRTFVPNGDTVLQEGDQLTIIGEELGLDEMKRLFLESE